MLASFSDRLTLVLVLPVPSFFPVFSATPNGDRDYLIIPTNVL